MAGVQQAITWASSDPVLYRYVVSLGHNKLSRCLGLFVFYLIFGFCNVDYEFQINMLSSQTSGSTNDDVTSSHLNSKSGYRSPQDTDVVKLFNFSTMFNSNA